MRIFSTFIAAVFLICLCGGCASHQVTISYFDSEEHAMVSASINGVSGKFAIDTGAPGSCLTMSAVRRCGIGYTHGHHAVMGIEGKLELLDATNIIVKLAPDFEMHFPRMPILPDGSVQTNGDFFGLIGYKTLANRHAVLDMKHKTITLTK
jgi:hypothetical protein